MTFHQGESRLQTTSGVSATLIGFVVLAMLGWLFWVAVHSRVDVSKRVFVQVLMVVLICFVVPTFIRIDRCVFDRETSNLNRLSLGWFAIRRTSVPLTSLTAIVIETRLGANTNRVKSGYYRFYRIVATTTEGSTIQIARYEADSNLREVAANIAQFVGVRFVDRSEELTGVGVFRTLGQ